MKRIIYRLLASALCCSMFFSNRVIYAADDTVANHFTTQVEEEPQDATDESSDNLENVEELEQNTESSTTETNNIDVVDDSSDDTETDTENTDSVIEESEEEQDDDPQITEELEEKTDIKAVKKDTVELRADSATAPTKVWVEISFAKGQSYNIEGFPRSGNLYELYLPGNVKVSDCKLFWDGGAQAIYENETYDSGKCPIPSANTSISKTYTFKNDNQELGTFNIITYQGSLGVPPVFIEIDETETTIAQMDNDPNHDITCTGTINIDGTWYVLEKMKGRGNATWTDSKDKKPYNVTLAEKISFPGLDSKKTDKWSFLAEALDHSLLCNRAGFYLGHQLGIAQDTASADVWMNGEYQGCYTITPKTDSFVTKEGFMIEQDNYKEDPVADGGDPQFKPVGFVEQQGNWSSVYNRITVKKIGKKLLGDNPTVQDIEHVAYEIIQPWFQEAWDAIRADDGINPDTGKYYTDYIDIESFAKMYLIHEYVKSYDVCAGSLLFFRDGMTDDHKLIAGPLWDLDNALGATYRNSALGKADDKRNGDRRSAEGYFIDNITEYKTSIYKTLSRHEDFMAEVLYQYNLNHEAFENLPQEYNRLMAEIEDSARMNHYKVDDIPGDYQQWTGNYQGNNHRYGQKTTLGSGQYQQTYLATNNSRTDWKNYADNLGTFIRVRSLWFQNNWTVESKTVTFDANGGTGTMDTQSVFPSRDTELDANVFVKDGYTFTGWNTKPDGTGTAYADKEIVNISENLTLYAQWMQTPLITFGASLILDGTISVNYYIEIPDDKIQTFTARAIVNNRTIFIPGEEAKREGDNLYSFRVPVAAKEIRDWITFQILDRDGNPVRMENKNGVDRTSGYVYSVYKYVSKQRTGTLKALCDAINTYGSYAQVQFNHNPDTAEPSDVSAVTAETVADYSSKKTGELPDGLKYDGTSLILESETVVRMYFIVSAEHNISEYHFYNRKGEEINPVNSSGNTYYVDVENVPAKRLFGYSLLKATDGTKTFTIEYSPYTYVKNKLNETAEGEELEKLQKLQNLCRALYLYGEAAKTYFENPTGN